MLVLVYTAFHTIKENPDLSPEKIRFLQHNLHKRKEANMDISKWTEKSTISLCQEPNHNKGKITNITNGLKVVTGFGKKPRACIVLHPGIEYFQLNQFSNNDMVAITIKSKTSRTIVIASVYMPYDSPDPPPSVLTRELISFCTRKGWSLILGSDVNSHNTAWGSSDCNPRGDNLLEYIMTTDLQICNRGNAPTFSNIIRSEVIDITLVSTGLADNIENWQVSHRETFSDHNLIEFELNFDHTQRPTSYRQIR